MDLPSLKMPSILQLQALLFFVLATYVLAIPTPSQPQKRSFIVERVPNPAFKGRSPGAGTRALIKAYRKYNQALPAGLLEAMNSANSAAAPATNAATEVVSALENAVGGKGSSKKAHKSKGAAAAPAATAAAASNAATSNSSSGTVTATPEQGDIEYLSPVTIGGQTMNMDFDSGSSDLWVFDTQLSTKSQAGHTNFDATKSTSFKLLTGASFSISYGDGSGAAGNVGTDTVNIGGATVTSQAIELATAVSASFVEDTQSNGLVGLAFSKLNTVQPNQQKTFFDNAMGQGLAEPVFTADLRKNAAGAYTFGAIDSTKFNGSLSWAQVNTTNGFWQFSSSKFAVGSGATMSAAGGQAIADTGTTLMLASAAIVNAYYSQVTGAVNNATVGGVTFPCSATLPDLSVDVGGSYMAVVRGDDINFAEVDATGTSKFQPTFHLRIG